MDESEDIASKRFWRFARSAGLALALVMLLGMAGGFTAAHIADGEALGLVGAAILGAMLLAAAGCGWLLLREMRRPTGEEPLTPRERLNRNIIIGCGVLGLIVGMALSLGGGVDMTKGGGVFTNEPLPPALALALVALTGVLLPLVSVFWHRSAVDELETEAYKTGALYAVYVYMIGAPVWWLLWRGGFVPAPDGIIIYFAVILTLGAVWMRKKHG